MASFLAAASPSRAESLPAAAETGECSLEGAVPATVAAVDEDFELLLDDGRRAALAGLDFPPPEMAELRAAIRSRLRRGSSAETYSWAFLLRHSTAGAGRRRGFTRAIGRRRRCGAPHVCGGRAARRRRRALSSPIRPPPPAPRPIWPPKPWPAMRESEIWSRPEFRPNRRLCARRSERVAAPQGNDCRRRRHPLRRRVAARLLP